MAYKAASVDASEEGMNRVGGKIPFLTIPGGTPPQWKTTRLRIYPPRDDHPDDTYYFWVATHGKLPGANRPILCPQKMYDEFCPACEIGNKLWNEGRKEDARPFFASWRAMVNVVVLNRDGTLPDDASIKVWGIPKGVMEDLQAKLKELPKNKRDITNPIGGYDILVRRKGTGLDGGKDTTYEINTVPDPSDLSDLGDAAIDFLDQMIALDTIYERSSGERVAGLLEAPKTVGTPRLAAPVVDPWDEDDEDNNVVEANYTVVDADAEPAPAPAAKAAPRAPAKSAKPANANQQEARDRLLAKLGKPVLPVEVEDDGENEEEEGEDED